MESVHHYKLNIEVMNGKSLQMPSTNTMDPAVSHNISEFSIVFSYSTHDRSTEQNQIFFAPRKKGKGKEENCEGKKHSQISLSPDSHILIVFWCMKSVFCAGYWVQKWDCAIKIEFSSRKSVKKGEHKKFLYIFSSSPCNSVTHSEGVTAGVLCGKKKKGSRGKTVSKISLLCLCEFSRFSMYTFLSVAFHAFIFR